MEKINVAELLKDCPEGMELDCTTWENVTFEEVRNNTIIIRRNNKEPYFDTKVNLNQYGCCTNYSDEKCRIYPKGKTTWEGFVPPSKFKDGDVVRYSDCIAIFKEWGDATLFRTYVTAYLHGDSTIDVAIPLFGKSIRRDARLATEEEKEKLFQTIKDKGYRWNSETKTLEKLPKFKVGDKIFNVLRKSMGALGTFQGIISEITDDKYIFTDGSYMFINSQDNYELVPVEPKFKVGNKVKRKGVNYTYIVTIVGIYEEYYTYVNQNGEPASISIKNQDEWELVPNKFDITTLVPFESRVLVRDNDKEKWHPAFWGFHDVNSGYPYKLIGCIARYCIPYEGNEHLLGTTDDCDNYFKTWE